MNKVYELYRVFKHFNVKYQDIIARIENNARYYSLPEDKRGEKYKKVTIEEISEVLAQGKSIPLDLNKHLEPLSERFLLITKFQQNFRKLSLNNLNTQQLQALKQEAQSIGIHFNEIDQIKTKNKLSIWEVYRE